MEIGRLPNERAAQALVDYLKGEGIPCRITHLEQGVAIHVIEDTDQAKGRKAFLDFVQDPLNPSTCRPLGIMATTESALTMARHRCNC